MLQSKITHCQKCSTFLNDANGITKAPDRSDCIDNQDKALQRIRELELELAQTKLAQVEAECRNQDLTHQLRSTEVELTSAKNNWPPWLSKTLSSIKEVANKKDFGPFNTNVPTSSPSFISHINSYRRDSNPLRSTDYSACNVTRRDSAPIIKDSQSCSSLKTQN